MKLTKRWQKRTHSTLQKIYRFSVDTSEINIDKYLQEHLLPAFSKLNWLYRLYGKKLVHSQKDVQGWG